MSTQAVMFETGPVIPEEPDYQYSIIYSVDCTKDEPIGQFEPPERKKLWAITEDDDQRSYDYLCNCGADDEGTPCTCGWKYHKHRKYCAILNQEQFDAFIEAQYLTAEDVETMGSIGAPGFGFGHAPAISFNSDDPAGIQNAYVTPCPKEGDEFWPTEEAWTKVRQQIIDKYENI